MFYWIPTHCSITISVDTLFTISSRIATSSNTFFKKYKETGQFDENEVYPYLTEGIGEDILPKNVDFDLIDHFVKVTDKDSAIMTRKIAREEGLFIGWSCGSAVYGALEYARDHLKDDDLMVVILPDHGTRYLAKVYNDNWMKDHGFFGLHLNTTVLFRHYLKTHWIGCRGQKATKRRW